MAVILEATNVAYRYSADREMAMFGVDLRVEAGTAVGIVGESGSGKSTLAKLLTGVLTPTAGTVHVKGRPWDRIGPRGHERRSIQMIFQDPYGALNPWMTATETVTEVVRRWESVSRTEARRRAESLLDDMGLSRGAMQRRPRELSGGQCQRVGIARALACRPDVLVADEPTSALDVSVQAQILNILVELRTSQNLAIVLISHDLAVVNYVTDSALVMYRGAVVERGPTHDLLSSPAHPYTRRLLDSMPGRPGPTALASNDVLVDHPCRFAARCALLQPDCVDLPKYREGVAESRYVDCVHPLEGTPRDLTDRSRDRPTPTGDMTDHDQAPSHAKGSS